jgi:gephyrin
MASAKYKMISIPEVQATVLKHATALPTEVVPLASSLGRILSEDVFSKEPLPPFPASIKVWCTACYWQCSRRPPAVA